MITEQTFREALVAALNSDTIYIKGGFGLKLDKKGKDRCIAAYDYNKKREALIRECHNNYFGFDCCGLVKGCAGGFTGDLSKTYGGAIYNKDHTLGANHDIPDVTEKGLIDICDNVTKCKKVSNPDIPPFSLLWMTGHCGVYIGDNKVVESTPSGSDGVQITEYDSKNWMKWGLLPFVKYSEKNKPITIVPPVARPTLRVGSKGLQVYYLQQDLDMTGEYLEIDGIFGSDTKKCLMNFQRKMNIDVDGIYGPITHKKMLEVMR